MHYNWRKETTGLRLAEQYFSKWHRENPLLDINAGASDVDLFIYNEYEDICGLFEVKLLHVRQNEYIKKRSVRMQLKLAKAVGVPLILLWNDAQNPIFYVYEIESEEDLRRYDERRFNSLVKVYDNESMTEYLTKLRHKR